MKWIDSVGCGDIAEFAMWMLSEALHSNYSCLNVCGGGKNLR